MSLKTSILSFLPGLGGSITPLALARMPDDDAALCRTQPGGRVRIETCLVDSQNQRLMVSHPA